MVNKLRCWLGKFSLYIPFLLLISSFYHVIRFQHSVIPLGTSFIHILLAILFVCISYITCNILKLKSLMHHVIWQTICLSIFIIWNIVTFGSLFTQEKWGGTLSFSLLMEYIRFANQAEVNYAVQTVKNFNTSFIGIFISSILIYFILARIYFDRRFVRLARISLPIAVITLIIGFITISLISLANSEYLYNEPFLAFIMNQDSPFNLNGSNQQRFLSDLRDQQLRTTYKVTKKPKDNVILIVSDSLRADHLKMYGYNRDTTPFLTKLYQQKKIQKVEYAFSSCSDSYCGISSMLTSHTYDKISLESVKFYELLSKSGFKTKLIVSGEHNFFANLGAFYGKVDEKYTYLQAKTNIESDETILKYLDQLPYNTPNNTPQFMFFFLMSTHVLGDRFAKFDHFKPAYIDTIKDQWDTKDSQSIMSAHPETNIQNITNNYDNGIMQGDWIIKQIFETLQKKAYLKHALIIIVGDHGDSLGEHNQLGHTYNLYNEEIRIPLLIWDSNAQPLKNKYYATQADIAPTIFFRLGLPIPTSWVGQSLYMNRKKYASIHLTRRGKEPCGAVITQDNLTIYKFITCKQSGGINHEMLFNITNDKKESINLLRAYQHSSKGRKTLTRYRKLIPIFYNKIINECKSVDCVD